MGKQRLNHCYAPGCSTGYTRADATKKPSLFMAPADPERWSLWQRNLHRTDKELAEDCALYELHFEPQCVVRDYVHIINGEEVRLPRGKPTLSSDAVPTILPNAPAYLRKRVVPRRNMRNHKAEEINRPAKKVLFSSAGERQTRRAY
ncbi:hypothetical protein HPB49_004412 [Dermacentor silvarum]|uniref:Uncharacterized protein n=1 Tax=Dermacentor silvarum TaxID=543639 RepID=A0ACB8DIT2_DERSI|nr:hypothetical protein HPB49_004412 [Dermacentor silvarum]